MTTERALQLFVAFSALLLLLRPVSGLIMDVFKVMLRLGVTGLILHVLPFDFIDKWSQYAAGFARISSVYVPVAALIALVTLTTVNISALRGKPIEQYLRIGLYIIGGVFTVGSKEWIAWENSVGDVVIGALGIITNSLDILRSVLTP